MKKASTVLGLAIMAAAAGSASAQTQGRIEFKGSISADTCYLSNAGGDAQVINVQLGVVNTESIGSVAAPSFSGNAGTGSADLKVVCKADSSVKMTLAAPAGETSADGRILRVNGGSTAAGYAQNVGIAVYPSTSSKDAFDLKSGVLVDRSLKAGESVSVKFVAAYVANGVPTPPAKPGEAPGPAPAPTAGVANATLPFVITTN
ncbi:MULTISPECIES: fimbrial protein [unclassified Achromobacter]|uniref:fimbrial protein n=1 Tax=unclassified Achromobacter TaxID=2626865 RepID=UPI00069FA4F2|nr:MULTISPECIES: fimbrial protein [unclassified Achromobacter]KOF53126.1 hypothetical protein AD428_15690 [Achromobacter sp. DMS1]